MSKTINLVVKRGKDNKLFSVTNSAYIKGEYIGEIMCLYKGLYAYMASVKLNNTKSTRKQFSLDKLD